MASQDYRQDSEWKNTKHYMFRSELSNLAWGVIGSAAGLGILAIFAAAAAATPLGILGIVALGSIGLFSLYKGWQSQTDEQAGYSKATGDYTAKAIQKSQGLEPQIAQEQAPEQQQQHHTSWRDRIRQERSNSAQVNSL